MEKLRTRVCSRCCGGGIRTPEGRVFVVTTDPDYQRLTTCPNCEGKGYIEIPPNKK